MPSQHDPDEGLGGRLLLATIAFGLVPLGLLAAVTMPLDEDAGPYDGLYGLAMIAIGLTGLVAAAIGRAFGRWMLAGLGVILLGQAIEIAFDFVASAGAPSRFMMLLLATVVILGAVAITVAVHQTVAHRKRVQGT